MFAAIYDTFYWIAHLYIFMHCSKNDDNVSGDASVLSITRKLASFSAPILGALILFFFDRKILISTSIFFLILSVIPLLKIKNVPDKPRRKQKNFREFFSSWDVVKDYLILCFYGIHSATEDIIWPLFVFLFFSDINSVAAIPVIVSLTTMFFTYWAGKINKKRRGCLMIFGGVSMVIVWLLRLILENSLFYYFSIFLISLFSILISIPLDSEIFEKGEKIDTLSASTWRNTASMLFRVLLYGTLIVLVNVFNISFILAALSILVVVAINSSFIFLLRKNKQ